MITAIIQASTRDVYKRQDMESMELRIDKRNKYNIDEELYRIAKRVPYNLFIIKVANIYLSMADKLRKIPKDINIKKFSVKGYQNLPVPVELIESVNNNETLPAMLYIHEMCIRDRYERGGNPGEIPAFGYRYSGTDGDCAGS